jgi:ubiquinone/menaquinone biosynthesis C-methylase UbiE
MSYDENHSTFDPYRSFEQSLKTGDVINRWILSRPRRRIVQLLKGQRVLDVCCGTGNLTAMLASAGCQVVGVDSSPTMLSHARQKQIAAEFKQMDAAQLPFNNEFDAAVISIALHEMSPQVRGKVWESMCRAVHPTGRLIALDFTVPQRNSFFSRIASSLIERDERGFIDVHPEHYENFKEFMRNGGLLSWIQEQSQPLEAEYRFLAGTVAVIVTGQSK